MGFLQRDKKSLEELQEEDESLTTEKSIAEKRAVIKKINQEYGEGGVKAFSDNGKASGFNFARAIQWLKSH
ncbi:hypothetical protein LCGC14_1211230 [marine sediment metagenome]|uniref:Uncharacterized protein n=1 Tax=marine sediment metagenome TaxID=412755 RepID=A0A0F9LDU4_9ZZZZ